MKPVLVAALVLFVPLPASAQMDFGDAPDSLAPCSGLAYPDIGVYGHFPTIRTSSAGVCRGERVSNSIGGLYFGPGIDADPGAAPALFPPYDTDECYLDGDAGLIAPTPWTIVTGGALECGLRYAACAAGGGSIGSPCGQATWRIALQNNESSFAPFVNVLVDWNRDGDWCDAVDCDGRVVEERLVTNVAVLETGNVELVLENLPVGSTPGYVWARISVERQMRVVNWDGSGAGEEGESEDYLLLVGNPSAVRPSTWGSIKARYGS